MLHEERKLKLLWEKIEEHFANKRDVLKLTDEMHRLEEGLEITSSNVAKTAANIVLKKVHQDIDNLGKFTVEICEFVDDHGFPGVKEVSFNKIYLTPCPGGKDGYEWYKWIALPDPNGHRPWKWERLSFEKIDLTWAKVGMDKINKELEITQKRLEKYSKTIAHTLMNNAIRPLEELKRYVVSHEYIDYVYAHMPRANITRDGLMTSGQSALLDALAMWANYDTEQIGGGALNDNYVRMQLKKNGVTPVENKHDKNKKHDR